MENTLLNLVPASYLPEVHLSQYDVGRELKFTLKDGSSDYTVPSGAVVTVKATKPSGLGFVVNASADGNIVTLSNTETMTNENGRFPAELSIVQGQNVIGTSNFIFNVERSPHPEGTIDGDAESLLPELTLLVERIEAAADSVDEDTQIVTEAKAEVLQAKADTLQAKADTLTARDDALQAKADAITAKESAEASAQAAEEASERAEELIGSVSTKADAIVKTASGEIASFTDGGDDLPMKSLLVNIVPKQSGSGDPSPSNVRPISGYSEVDIMANGNNAMPNALEKSVTYAGITYTSDGQGGFTVRGTATGTDYMGVYLQTPFVVPPASTHTCYFMNSQGNGGVVLRFMNESEVIDSWTLTTANKVSTNYSVMDGKYCNGIRIWVASGTTVDMTIKPMFVPKSVTVDSFIPYQGNTYPISLGQTVYGGTLDVVSGKLTITKVAETLNNMRSVSRESPQGYFVAIPNYSPKAYGTVAGQTDAISSCFKLGTGAQIYNNTIDNAFTVASLYISDNQINIRANAYANGTELKNALGNEMICYELRTPLEIQLTPTEVKTLLGNNNIWSDSGSVEVEYRADTTLAYNELVAMILENIGN